MAGDPKVSQIQTALNAQWEANLSVDGKWGPNTCAAAYDYQKYWLFDDSTLLKKEFFTELGLPGEWVYLYEMACTPYYTGEGTAPVPVTSKAPSEVPSYLPEPSTADWRSWIIPVAGAASGVLIGLAGREVVGGPKGDPILFGGMGGLVGLVGGLVVRGALRKS